jgi:hypothetical protein
MAAGPLPGSMGTNLALKSYATHALEKKDASQTPLGFPMHNQHRKVVVEKFGNI